MAGLLRARQAPGPGRSPSLIPTGSSGTSGTSSLRGAPTTTAPQENSPNTGPSRDRPRKSSPGAAPTRYFREKLAQHATNRQFWAVLSSQGELFRAHSHHQTKQGELCTARGAGDGTKLSRHTPPAGPPGTKLSRHARNTHFRRILRQQGEFCTAFATNRPRREKKVTHQHSPRPTNAPLPQFRMQFDCMKFQQCSETLQFQNYKFIV